MCRGENTDLQQLLFHACFFFPRFAKSLSFSSSMCALGAPNLRTGTMEQKRFHRSRTFASPASFPGNPPCPSHPWPVLAGCGRCWPGCHQLAVAAPSCGVAAGWWRLGWGWVPVFQPNSFFRPFACFFIFIFDKPIIGNYWRNAKTLIATLFRKLE